LATTAGPCTPIFQDVEQQTLTAGRWLDPDIGSADGAQFHRYRAADAQAQGGDTAAVAIFDVNHVELIGHRQSDRHVVMIGHGLHDRLCQTRDRTVGQIAMADAQTAHADLKANAVRRPVEITERYQRAATREIEALE